jgi:hypothetical protein
MRTTTTYVYVGLAPLLAAACAGVRPERGHDQVAAMVAARARPAHGWEHGPPPEAQVAEWVRAGWRRVCTRASAVEIALLNNPRLQTTYEELGVSQADMVQAGLLRNPVLAGSVLFGHRDTVEGEASLVQDFLDLFVLRQRKRIAPSSSSRRGERRARGAGDRGRGEQGGRGPAGERAAARSTAAPSSRRRWPRPSSRTGSSRPATSTS